MVNKSALNRQTIHCKPFFPDHSLQTQGSRLPQLLSRRLLWPQESPPPSFHCRVDHFHPTDPSTHLEYPGPHRTKLVFISAGG